jgi:hypothetical protein
MRKGIIWTIALMAVMALVAATAGGAAAAKPSLTADIEITDFAYGCDFEGGFAVTASVRVDVVEEGTNIESVGLALREYRPLAAYEQGYYPFDTTIDVADWFSYLSGRETPLGTQVLHEVSTSEDFGLNEKSHFWNTTLTGADPDPASWFLVEARADGSVSQRGRSGGENRWDHEYVSAFLRCEPQAEFVPSRSPWDDWNWPNEP